MKKALCGVIAAAAILLCAYDLPQTPEPEPEQEPVAELVSYKVRGAKGNTRSLSDGSETTSLPVSGGSEFTLFADGPVGGLYVLWDQDALPWELIGEGETLSCGENGYRHEYVALSGTEETLTIRLSDTGKSRISEIYAFSPGRLPDWVQVWEPPCERADILVIPTHADDEFIFFGGVIPLYAGERGLNVQVVYMVNHQARIKARNHELLNGLWLAGVRNYPVINDVPEYRIGSMASAQSYYQDEFTIFQVEMIRRFQPQVIVDHDVNGEYHSAVHSFNTKSLMQAVELAADASYHPESAERWGVWDTPKTYLHLYGPEDERTILDYETPLAAFGGKTAFQVAQEAYALHKSQQHLHYRVFEAGSAYDSHSFGLYRTLVGPDVERNDLMENLRDRNHFPA